MPIRVEVRVTAIEHHAYYISDSYSPEEAIEMLITSEFGLNTPYYIVQESVEMAVTHVERVITHHNDPMIKGEISGPDPSTRDHEPQPRNAVTKEQRLRFRQPAANWLTRLGSAFAGQGEQTTEFDEQWSDPEL